MNGTFISRDSVVEAGEERTAQGVRPVAEKERIVSIDVLRGFALLGILPMNNQYFSMIGAAYLNPTACGDETKSAALAAISLRARRV